MDRKLWNGVCGFLWPPRAWKRRVRLVCAVVVPLWKVLLPVVAGAVAPTLTWRALACWKMEKGSPGCFVGFVVVALVSWRKVTLAAVGEERSSSYVVAAVACRKRETLVDVAGVVVVAAYFVILAVVADTVASVLVAVAAAFDTIAAVPVRGKRVMGNL